MNYFFGYTKQINLSANERKDITLQLDGDADFVIERIYANYDEPFEIQIADSTRATYWFYDKIRAENFFGTPQYPNELAYPIELKKNTRLTFDIKNLSANANNVEIVFEGYKIFHNIALSPKKPYWYVKRFSVTALNIITDSLLITSDADFLIQKFIGYITENYSLQLKLNFSALSGRYIYSGFTNFDNIFGSLLRPNVLKHPIKATKNSIITFEVKNLTNDTQDVELVFDGVKL